MILEYAADDFSKISENAEIEIFKKKIITRNDVYEHYAPNPLLVKKGSQVFNTQIYKGQ